MGARSAIVLSASQLSFGVPMLKSQGLDAGIESGVSADVLRLQSSQVLLGQDRDWRGWLIIADALSLARFRKSKPQTTVDGHNTGALQNMLQFANVSRPLVALQFLEIREGPSEARAAYLSRESSHKMLIATGPTDHPACFASRGRGQRFPRPHSAGGDALRRGCHQGTPPRVWKRLPGGAQQCAARHCAGTPGAGDDCVPRRAIRYASLRALDMQDRDFGWTIEMQIKAFSAGLRVLEIPVPYRRRVGRSKISGTVLGTIRAGVKILWTIGRFACTGVGMTSR